MTDHGIDILGDQAFSAPIRGGLRRSRGEYRTVTGSHVPRTVRCGPAGAEPMPSLTVNFTL